MHQLEEIPGGHRCVVCKWRWRLYPSSLCPGVERFAYAQVPPSMKTYTQLRAQGLKPADRARPDGCYYAVHRRDWLWFYDERQAVGRHKATPAQLQALAKAREAFIAKYTCLGCGKKPQTPHDRKDLVRGYCSACRWEAEQERLSAQIEMDGEAAYAWAAGLLQREDWAILDLETTSLSGAIVEIAVVDREGRTLFHSLVNPQMPITEEARAVHRISDEEVAHAPTLPEVWDAFLQALEGRQVIVTYNTEFDKGILESEARRYGLVRSQQTWHCLMRKYAEYVGDWSDSWHDYRWYPLPSSNHRAVGDALAALTLMQRMAAACATKPLELAQKIEKEGAYG